MTARSLAALAALLLVAGAASLVSAQGDVKPRPWTPGAPKPPSTEDSLRAANAAAAAAAAQAEPAERTLPTEAGTTRTLDMMYEPGVPDSILPLVPVYREVPFSGAGTVYVGSLRQDLPTHPYPVALKGAVLKAQVDGETGQTHVAIVIMVPWFGDILPLPRTKVTLGVKVDDGAEQEWKIECTPGPNLYIPTQRPLPVSNPGLVLVPLPPGPHQLAVRIKQLDATYLLVEIAQPRLTPLAVERKR